MKNRNSYDEEWRGAALSLEEIGKYAHHIGPGRAGTYREFLIVRLSPIDCGPDWVVCDKYTRDIVNAFDKDQFQTVEELQDWLDRWHFQYWEE